MARSGKLSKDQFEACRKDSGLDPKSSLYNVHWTVDGLVGNDGGCNQQLNTTGMVSNTNL